MAANYALNSLHVPQRVRVRSFAFNYLAILTAKTLRALKARIFRWFLTRLSAGVLEVHQVKARRKGRKRPPLGLLVIAKLTLIVLYHFFFDYAIIFALWYNDCCLGAQSNCKNWWAISKNCCGRGAEVKVRVNLAITNNFCGQYGG